MTTIEEEANMDEFFNFEKAAGPQAHHDAGFADLESGPYDIDLAFADLQTDENCFQALQHFSDPKEQFSLGLDELNQDHNAFMDTTMMGPDDFTDFPRWIDGMDVPSDPCAYCRRMRIHCKVLREGLRKGSCTSCVALARSCSLTHAYESHGSHSHTPPLQAPYNNAAPDAGNPGQMTDSLPLPQPCEYCHTRNLQCILVQWGERAGSCANCIAFACPCTMATMASGGGSEWKGDAGMISKTSTPPISPGLQQNRSFSSLVGLNSSDENVNTAGLGDHTPKIGARFSRESLRILKAWLSTHTTHPYPSDEEKESLRRQTGLNKTQITNWLANARRRGKVRAPRSTSPSVRSYPNAMDIPRRAGTPALETMNPLDMNPLERWKHSPPENEPASVTAIARAVTSSAFTSPDSPRTSRGVSDDGSARSLCNVSSASSLDTSQSSGGSFASAFSHRSHGSLGSFGSFGSRGRRRRRKAAIKPTKASPNLTAHPRTYQCTFCTETFKTKHDWQRHEKSLHLSLERWVCCPSGPTQFSADYGHNRCVFCGLSNPPDDHCEVHNYSSCAERLLEERTFYRKDHLRQHLSLVHDAKFQNFSMELWKVVTPEIRSRCGFCGIVMDSWSFRIDHLAEHFKGGKSMADWKGDWGFEPQVLDIVENGMPPYLIHDERNSMNPYESSKSPAGDEKTLEDLIKIRLVEYLQDSINAGGVPTDDELLVQARKIINRADELRVGGPENSWFCDLIMFTSSGNGEDSETVPSPFGNSRNCGRDTLVYTQNMKGLNGQCAVDSIRCPKERALYNFVTSKQALGLIPADRELQAECCKILDDVEATSNFKCKSGLAWFKYLITHSTGWLSSFRRRAGLPRSSAIASEQIRSTDDKSIDYSINNHARLEKELKDWARFQVSTGRIPSDEEIQHQARLIVFKSDDPWNQTMIDDPAILLLFKRQTGLAGTDDAGLTCLDLPTLAEAAENTNSNAQSQPSPKSLHWDLQNTEMVLPTTSNCYSRNGKFAGAVEQPLHTMVQNQPSCNTNPTQPLKYFLNDANCYGRLVRELSRFVTTCMSSNNPNQHVPTDAEIQNQARWIIYDDDDPWNQTAADNAEWLIRFKRDINLLPPESGPGLPLSALSWQIKDGGTGFEPPYLKPKDGAVGDYHEDVAVKVDHRVYTVKKDTAVRFSKGLSDRYSRPAKVFCSRELETSLAEFVKEELGQGRVPMDETLRAKARCILGVEEGTPTAADEPELLEKFKKLYGIIRTGEGENINDTIHTASRTIPEFDEDTLAQFDRELEGMDFSGMELPMTMDGAVGNEVLMQDGLHASSSTDSLDMMLGLGTGTSTGIQSLPSAVSSSDLKHSCLTFGTGIQTQTSPRPQSQSLLSLGFANSQSSAAMPTQMMPSAIPTGMEAPVPARKENGAPDYADM